MPTRESANTTCEQVDAMHGQYSIQDCALMGGPIAAEPF